ncbi:Panacea domain-containing protein [Pelosinus fermentans]|uniref:Antitoxin SocA-like Panacea domain-containing protein n=1 Tax=Pelosinus fermentans JBW45 TaxID=1192197 RepID=I8TQN0_9FIRM|nr:type II toxin-antitoxin system antitoxin SocA domain-containing protein [Pelosinus fermentans]AJQ26922.1 protein of unknown function DUF4065 [Pelosinus fermentans JBW45]
MKYSALEVAKYILTYCFKADTPISNLKLQKLLYFVQGEFYKEKGEPLFTEDISAWQFGPVVPDVYYEFCVYAGTPILNSYTTEIGSEDKQLINSVIKAKVKTPTWKLVEETHAVDTPWYEIYNKKGNRSVIPKNLIFDYFYATGTN